jgi:hypothetical protein
MRRAFIATFAVLCGCISPPPRDTAWFESHPDDAARVVGACTTGAGSNECENARTAIAHLKSKARMERYRKGFQ